MRQFFIATSALLLMNLTSVHAAEMCTQPKLETIPADHPECLFYSGTANFRRQEYALAGQRWQELIDLANVSVEYEYLRTDAHNNLGYLLYTGLGVQKDRTQAIEHWMLASKLGNEESAYHLCHAYGDMSVGSYQPAKALPYCKEALRRYSRLKNVDEGQAETVAQVQKYISRLESGFP